MSAWRRPRWWAVVLLVAGEALFIQLGLWQLHRASAKEALLQRFAQAAAQPVRPFTDIDAELDAALWPHVRLRGRLLGDRRYVLDNQSRHHRPGIIVYAPLEVCRDASCDSVRPRAVLVALGFLQREKGWSELPKLPPVPAGIVELTGLYAPPPGKGLELGGNALAAQHDWPKLTTYLDLDQVAHDLLRPLEPRVLLVDADPASAYIRSWSPATMPPARHRAYALQWFTFALAALVIFVVMLRRRPTRRDN